MSKTVRVHDPATGKINVIPSAELAPGMVEAQVEGVGRVWINSATVNPSGKFKHPPFEPELRDFIEREIQKPLADVWPKTLAQWEDNFRRDAEPEQEIGLWCRIAERFTEFSESEELNPAQRQECFAIMLHLAVEVREYFIPDFSNWKDHDAFESAFARLKKDLEAENSKK
jgi:hypothetical protein